MIFYTLLKHHTDKLEQYDPPTLRYSSKKRKRDINKTTTKKDLSKFHPSMDVSIFEKCSLCSDLLLVGTVVYKCNSKNMTMCLSCYESENNKSKKENNKENNKENKENNKEETSRKANIDNNVPIINTFFYKGFTNYDDLYSIIVKKSILRDYAINNPFLNDNQKNIMLDLYSKAIKQYHSLNKLARIIKLKKVLRYENDTDLCLNDLSDLSDNIKYDLYIQKTNTVYTFRISDLISVIENALTHAPDNIIEPYFPRNPYTNQDFTKAELYNIYFRIKDSTYIMPQLFHNFFLVDFDLKNFATENDSILRDFAVTQYMENMSTQGLIEEYHEMRVSLKQYVPRTPYNCNLREVSERLKPQIKLFLRYCYTNIPVKRHMLLRELKTQLIKLREQRIFFKKNLSSNPFRRLRRRIRGNSHIVDGVFHFGYDPENEPLESESSITSSSSNTEMDVSTTSQGDQENPPNDQENPSETIISQTTTSSQQTDPIIPPLDLSALFRTQENTSEEPPSQYFPDQSFIDSMELDETEQEQHEQEQHEQEQHEQEQHEQEQLENYHRLTDLDSDDSDFEDLTN
jgi:hypothetical protein